MNIIHTTGLAMIAVLALVLAGCTASTPGIEHPSTFQVPTLVYTSYGGFVMQDMAVTTLTVNATHATLQTFDAAGNPTSFKTRTLTQAHYSALTRLTDDFVSLAPQYPASPDTMVIADIGSINITVFDQQRSHTVTVLQEYDPALPDSLTRLRDALRDVLDLFYENGFPETSVLMSFQPMQCEQTPWDAWYAEGHIQFIVEPTLSQLVEAYYGDKGILVTGTQRVDSGMMVCEACSVCPESYFITAMVDAAQVDTMIAAGWTIME